MLQQLLLCKSSSSGVIRHCMWNLCTLVPHMKLLFSKDINFHAIGRAIILDYKQLEIR